MSILKESFKNAVSESEFAHSAGGPLRTAYMRQQSYRSRFVYVAPTPHRLGLDSFNRKRKFHTVPTKEMLEMLIRYKSLLQQYYETKKRVHNPDILFDVSDGSVFRTLFGNDLSTIYLLFYTAEVELARALGSARNLHKSFNANISIANLHPWSRLKASNILLSFVCRSKDVKYFGLKKVLKPILSELIELEKTGISIDDNLVKVKLFFLIGDNLGAHMICGLLQNFSKSH